MKGASAKAGQKSEKARRVHCDFMLKSDWPSNGAESETLSPVFPFSTFPTFSHRSASQFEWPATGDGCGSAWNKDSRHLKTIKARMEWNTSALGRNPHSWGKYYFNSDLSSLKEL